MSQTPPTPPAHCLSWFLESCIEHILSNKESKEECSICFEFYHIDDLPVQIPNVSGCNHIFGRTCLALWLSDRDTCPICRAKLYRSLDSPRMSRAYSLPHLSMDPGVDNASSTETQPVDNYPLLNEQTFMQILNTRQLNEAVWSELRALLNEALDITSTAIREPELELQGGTTSGPSGSREDTTETSELGEDTVETPDSRENTTEAREAGEATAQARDSEEDTTETRESLDDTPEPQESREDLALLLAQIWERVNIRVGESEIERLEPIRRRSRLKRLQPRTAIARVLKSLRVSFAALVDLVR
jgi:hypothetical protein